MILEEVVVLVVLLAFLWKKNQPCEFNVRGQQSIAWRLPSYPLSCVNTQSERFLSTESPHVLLNNWQKGGREEILHNAYVWTLRNTYVRTS